MPRDAWRIALASAIGTSHISAGTPCQDCALHKLLETPDGTVLIIAVCDGAGSAIHSASGSQLAAATFVELVENSLCQGLTVSNLTRETAVDWIDEINRRISARAAESGHAVRDYACTLLGVVLGEEDAAYLQIGDGAIVVSESEGDGWSYIFWPQHGEYANSTNFVVSPDAADVLEFETGKSQVNDVAVFSDGIENLVLHQTSKTVHHSFFSQMFPAVRASTIDGLDEALSLGLEKYLSSPLICDRTDDDKTLVLASRAPRA